MTAITLLGLNVQLVIKSLTDRAKNMISIEAMQPEKSKVQGIFKSNGYNQNIINRS